MLYSECRKALTKSLIPFWNSLIDNENGGFYGEVDYNLTLDKKAPKGCILNSRILWFYSTAYMKLKDEKLLKYAKHAFDFLCKSFIDREKKGVFWSVSFDGKPLETIKHTYNIAFALYGVSAYYRATDDATAKKTADELFSVIENKCKAQKGYYESFTRDFVLNDNEELSENGIIASRTMNTLLHVLEAYNEYYLATKSNDAKKSIESILHAFDDYVLSKQEAKLGVFFDENYNTLLKLNSYGHDIEASWLLDKASEVIDDKAFADHIKEYDTEVAKRILSVAFDNGAVNNENENGIIDKTRIWWVQCESMIGFLNAYKKTRDKYFLDATNSVWKYIKDYFIDKRDGGEWYQNISYDNKPVAGMPIVSPWKCPYHNGRMVIEIMDRVKELESVSID